MSTPNRAAARLGRRALGLGVDATASALGVAALFGSGALSAEAFEPKAGWFLSEWWLKLWLDRPGALTAPLWWAAILALTWQLFWELTAKRTPGAMAAGITIWDRQSGEPISGAQAGLRALGAALNVATFGLGYALCFITLEGRALHELISGSVTGRSE